MALAPDDVIDKVSVRYKCDYTPTLQVRDQQMRCSQQISLHPTKNKKTKVMEENSVSEKYKERS